MIERVRVRLRGEGGYSLVEMLTVMVIMSIVFAGITSIFVSGSKAQAEQDRRFQAQLGTRLAMDKIRKDIHCASDLAVGYTTSAITLKLPSGCGGDVSWCTASVTGYNNRFRLYRQTGTTCSTANGVQIADYLVSGAVFPEYLHAIGCSCLASLRVDFVVSNKGSTVGVDTYELTDTVFLRNSTRV
jgi:prepilin-type N-terminal cleavage/methylation domain-containing protein